MTDARPPDGSVDIFHHSHSRLPEELVATIIRWAVPVYTRRIHCYDESHSRCKKYRSERAAFCDLALVSTAWCQVTRQEAFRDLVMFACSASNISLASVLPNYATHVRTIILEAQSGISSDEVSILDRKKCALVQESVRRCFELSIRLESMEVYGPQYLWGIPWRGPIYDTIPGPSVAPFHSLTWQFSSPIISQDERFRLALAHMGEKLEQLEIQDWRLRSLGWIFPPLKLSSVHPRLTRLTVVRGDQTAQEISHLVSRTVLDGMPEQVVSIRRLSLQGIVTLDTRAIIEILRSNDLGSHLTCVKIRLASRFECQQDAAMFPLSILEICTSLTSFAYTSPVSDVVFQHLPAALHLLELLVIVAPDASFRPEPYHFIQYIRSPRAQSLRHLRIMAPKTSGMEWKMSTLIRIDDECRRARILFECQELAEMVSRNISFLLSCARLSLEY